jgi:hypothetical protein
MNIFDWFHWRRRKEQHSEELREQTHDVINQLQRDIHRIHRQGQANRQHIDQLLSASNDELASVAARIAVAVGLAEREQRRLEREATMTQHPTPTTRGPRR